MSYKEFNILLDEKFVTQEDKAKNELNNYNSLLSLLSKNQELFDITFTYENEKTIYFHIKNYSQKVLLMDKWFDRIDINTIFVLSFHNDVINLTVSRDRKEFSIKVDKRIGFIDFINVFLCSEFFKYKIEEIIKQSKAYNIATEKFLERKENILLRDIANTKQFYTLETIQYCIINYFQKLNIDFDTLVLDGTISDDKLSFTFLHKIWYLRINVDITLSHYRFCDVKKEDVLKFKKVNKHLKLEVKK